jgi:hypothetical protein
MRLYSISEMTHLVQQQLHVQGFATVPIKRGKIEVKQFDASGMVSQTFIVTVKDKPGEPL